MAKPKMEEQLRLDGARTWDDATGIPGSAYGSYEHVDLKRDVHRVAELYEEGGRAPISPRLLAAVTILQYLKNVSDKAAVRNTFLRRDWRVALDLDSDYKGFSSTVLVRFRQRLVVSGMEEELFWSVLEEARRLGMLDNRRRLRVDGTRLLANVSHRTRGWARRVARRSWFGWVWMALRRCGSAKGVRWVGRGCCSGCCRRTM